MLLVQALGVGLSDRKIPGCRIFLMLGCPIESLQVLEIFGVGVSDPKFPGSRNFWRWSAQLKVPEL